MKQITEDEIGYAAIDYYKNKPFTETPITDAFEAGAEFYKKNLLREDFVEIIKVVFGFSTKEATEIVDDYIK